ncbi:MAG TPA: acyl-CoA dehydrogenase family protein [Labilithrix sp.]|nr:acyl-CoA dehydrogenase family protein [Labilithrix sp.]
MIEWSETDKMIQQAVRRFVDDEIRPRVTELEHGDGEPYEVLRKFFKAFSIDAMARETFRVAIEKQRAREQSPTTGEPKRRRGGGGLMGGGPGQEALSMIAVSELCRVSPGLVGAMGVSIGLAAGTIMARGTVAQKERWALDLLTFDKIGAWAITEPNSGSDAFGGMKSTVRPHGDGYVLNGQKTFITNGPYADTIVVYAKLDDGGGAADDTASKRNRKILSFVLDKGMKGLTQTKPFKKMGFHSSPTGELFFEDVYLEKERLLAGAESADDSSNDGRDSARSNFTSERFGVAAMSLGVIEECLALSVDYAKKRELWGQPIGNFQLIQLKLAKMEIARLNVQNMVFRTIEMLREGKEPTLAEASAMKLYSSEAATEVAMEAVQLFGGNGYMAEYRVEQLARDAKSFMIYAGSSEIQVTHIAKDLLRR